MPGTAVHAYNSEHRAGEMGILYYFEYFALVLGVYNSFSRRRLLSIPCVATAVSPW